MANEISVTSTFSITNNNLTYSSSESFNADQSIQGGPSNGTQQIGTTHETIGVTDITSLGWAVFKNLDNTNYIEVGVDVPNATLMIIENAERLGLAQLHQLRGRVGRGAKASHCVLMYKKPLSQQARERLAVMRETSSGFDIARKDLEMRGPGEVLGTRQTGLMSFRIADILRDEHMLTDVKQVASELMKHYPQHVEPLIKRWHGLLQQYAAVG